MRSITEDLAQLLKGITRAGEFQTSGTVEMFPPGLEVEGVGTIALPLLPLQAEQLIAVAERAPYGKGELTLTDTDVRRTWQIDAARVRLRGRTWPATLSAIVERAAQGLGVQAPVTAELYKLLVYDEGSFFVSHRDTEKTEGMFATLAIVLPSIFTGGELIVRHQGQEARLDLRREDPAEAAFAAFYADCPHEVAPVTSGCRLTLIYNLCRPGRGAAPRAPEYGAEQERLAERLRQWAADRLAAPENEPAKLIYPLEHAYTEESIGFAALKGQDAARAATLLAAAGAADCEAHLALLSIEESGGAEFVGDYRRYRRGRRDGDEADFEISEVYERSQTLDDWRRLDGRDPGLGPMAFDPREVSPPGALEGMKPDEVSFQEATGNEGASFERFYRAATLVVWPRRERLALAASAGLDSTLPYLTLLADQWTAAGESVGSPLWTQAHDLAGHIVALWPIEPWRSPAPPTQADRMLKQLIRLRDTARIDEFLVRVSAAGGYVGDDNEAILAAVGLLEPASRVGRLRDVVAGNADKLPAIASLMAGAAATLAGAAGGASDLRDAAEALLAVMLATYGDELADRSDAHQDYRFRVPGPSLAAAIVDVITALEAIDPALAAGAVDRVLHAPGTYEADTVITPAAITLGASAIRNSASARRLVDAAVTHLRARIALPLAPPADWRRDSQLSCDCPNCAKLAVFLDDPAKETWVFRAVQFERTHVEATIGKSRPDLTVATQRKGSPHSLIATKTQASYERRAAQRAKDLEALARLDRTGG